MQTDIARHMPSFSKTPASRSARTSPIPTADNTQPVRVAESPLRVFLVEDSPLFRERLTEKLESIGNVAVVGSADDEQTAVAALQTCKWDVAVLDLQLKHGSGLEVLRRLQELGRPPHTKVIVLTDHDFYLYRSKALEFGADMFFVKSREANLVIKLLRDLASKRTSSVHPDPRTA
jgi:DNA-binding NarL/FixJ family response regulator